MEEVDGDEKEAVEMKRWSDMGWLCHHIASYCNHYLEPAQLVVAMARKLVSNRSITPATNTLR